MSKNSPILKDILRKDLRLVVCGTAVGTESAEVEQFYAGPGNKFWEILSDVRLTPRKLSPSEASLLIEFGIGLTDLEKHRSGSDKSIDFKEDGVVALRSKIQRYQPHYLAFNGKKAAEQFFGRRKVEYGPCAERIGATMLFIAPSTSSAAKRWWDADIWKQLARLVRNSGYSQH